MRSSLRKEIGERIASIRGSESRPDFAKKFDIHKNTLERYENGDRTPDAEFLTTLADLGYNVHWVLTGEGDAGLSASMSDAHREMISDVIGEDQEAYKSRQERLNATTDLIKEAKLEGKMEALGQYAMIPLYNVKASAGHGSLVEREEIIDSLAFKKQWIHNELHANPSDLYLIYVKGDSMEPTLRAGDVILVNSQETSIRNDGLYVLIMDDTLLVKRLQSLPGGNVRISSDNVAYAPFEIEKSKLSPDSDGEPEGAGIVGRVVWSGRRM